MSLFVLAWFISIANSRILLTSTSEVYGDPLVHPQPESYWGNVNPIGMSILEQWEFATIFSLYVSSFSIIYFLYAKEFSSSIGNSYYIGRDYPTPILFLILEVNALRIWR